MEAKKTDDDLLKKHSLSPLTKEDQKEQEIGGAFKMAGYNLALCTKKDPLCVRYKTYNKGKVLHIICPSAEEGCINTLSYPGFEEEPDCAQKEEPHVDVSSELNIPEIITKFSGDVSEVIKEVSEEYLKKCNKFIKKLTFRKRL